MIDSIMINPNNHILHSELGYILFCFVYFYFLSDQGLLDVCSLLPSKTLTGAHLQWRVGI